MLCTEEAGEEGSAGVSADLSKNGMTVNRIIKYFLSNDIAIGRRRVKPNIPSGLNATWENINIFVD